MGLSAQATSIATTTYGISLGMVGSILIGSWLVIRWRKVEYWYHRVFSHTKRRNTVSIAERFITKLANVTDSRQLISIILNKIASTAATPDVSLIVNTHGKWTMKEVIGARPMTCQMELASPFLQWLVKHPKMISRRVLVEDARCAEIKGAGLQYCVQYHANWIIPLVLAGRLVAVINVGHPHAGTELLAEAAEIIDRLRPYLALHIHNAHLQDLVVNHQSEMEMGQRLKSQLLSNLSHELRTPIHSIIGLADVIKDNIVPEGASVSEYSGMIADAGRRLMDTITAMVDLAKLETNNVTLDVRRINLNKLVTKLGATVKTDDNVKLNICLPDDMLAVYGDCQWLSVALQQLISNAAKFTTQGEIMVDATRTGEMLRLGVHDTGVGIAKERQQAIFDGFVQETCGVNRSFEGSGLGLAITRKIIELHGGRICLESTPGKGSHFFVTLPLNPTRIQSRELRPCVNQ